MKNYNEAKSYDCVIAIKEMSAGNESVGNMWLETKQFDKNVSVDDIIKWASDCCGKLIISIDQ